MARNPQTRLTALTLAEYGTICHLCGEPGADSKDHLLPRAYGGRDTLDNLRPAHRVCNSRRGKKLLSPELLAQFRDTETTFRRTDSFELAHSFDSPALSAPRRSGNSHSGTEKNGASSREIVLIFGPPGAGKSTLARELAESENLELYDRDDDYWENESHFVRASMLTAATTRGRAVIIRSGATRAARATARARYRPTREYLLLEEPAELRRRIAARARPDAPASYRALKRWFDTFEPEPVES